MPSQDFLAALAPGPGLCMELPLSTFPRPFGLSPVGGGESQLQTWVKVVVYCSDLLTAASKRRGMSYGRFLTM